VWGWRAVFFVVGALGIVWVVFWLRNYFNPDVHPRVSAAELGYIREAVEAPAQRVPYRRILRMRRTWAFALAFALTAPVFWFYLYWLPPFLN
ncbi:MFS transporter, partial [Ralstonia solanacearum]|nr:MFS transporter [Ralstonia solanacearum]